MRGTSSCAPCISAARARTLLEPLNLFDLVELSAKAGVNVERAFEIIVAKIVHPDRPFIPQLPVAETLTQALH